VRKLADGIIEAQVREIGEMKSLIAELEAHPVPDNAPTFHPIASEAPRRRHSKVLYWRKLIQMVV
jgi:hypothetical protein